MLNILCFPSRITKELIPITLAVSIFPSLIQPKVVHANSAVVDFANYSFYLDSDHVKVEGFENYYFSGDDEFESSDSSELDEFESLDVLGIIEGAVNILPKLFGLGSNQQQKQQNQSPAPDPFALLASLGHQLIDCVPGVVFVTGLIPEAICVAPNFYLSPGQYVYNPYMNKIQPAVVNNSANTYNPYNPYNTTTNHNPYLQQANTQVNNGSNPNFASYNGQQTNVQVNRQVNDQSNTNFWDDGIFDDSIKNDDLFNF